MANNGHRTHIYVGLAGEGENIAEGGLLRRAEGEDDWQSITNGLPSEPQVRALLVLHPDNPAIVYAGTQLGVYRSDDRGDHWEALESPREGMDVWSLAFHPSNPDIIYAGYEPCSIYRTENAGESWKRMNTDRVAYPNVTTYMPPLAKRVIGIAADPSDPSDMYASIEVGGLLASRDGGESWDSITDGLYTENHTVDLHGVQVSSGGPRHRVHHRPGSHVQEPRPRSSLGAYPLRRDVPWRIVLSRPDSRARRPHTLYLAAGAGGGGAPAGTQEAGALFRSRDTGETWDRVDIGDTPPSRMFQIAIDRAAPVMSIAAPATATSTPATTAAKPGPAPTCPSNYPAAATSIRWSRARAGPWVLNCRGGPRGRPSQS